MQDLVYELWRIVLPRTTVNNGMRKGSRYRCPCIFIQHHNA
jgi:hypothetical protein